jgi:hypothetical protein
MSHSNGYRTLVKWIKEKGVKIYDLPLYERIKMRLHVGIDVNISNDILIVMFYLCVANDYFSDLVKVAETDMHEYMSFDIDRFKVDSIMLFGKISKREFEWLMKMLSSLPVSKQSYQQMANLITVLEMEWLGEEADRKEKIAAARRARYAAKRVALALGEVEMNAYAV